MNNSRGVSFLLPRYFINWLPIYLFFISFYIIVHYCNLLKLILISLTFDVDLHKREEMYKMFSFVIVINIITVQENFLNDLGNILLKYYQHFLCIKLSFLFRKNIITKS